MKIEMRPSRLLPVLLVGILLTGSAGHLFAQETVRPTDSTRTAPESPSASSAKDKEVVDENDAYRHSAAVQKFGAMLGMKPEQASTVFELTNFVILAVLVGWFLIKTLPKTFRDRSTSIQKNLADARTATEEASARLGLVEERLAKLDDQIAAMRTEAERDSAIEEQRIKAAVEEDKKKMVAAAEHEIAAATLHARKQIQQYAAELAIEQAGRKLVVTAEVDRLLVQNFVRRLGGDDSGKGQN